MKITEDQIWSYSRAHGLMLIGSEAIRTAPMEAKPSELHRRLAARMLAGYARQMITLSSKAKADLLRSEAYRATAVKGGLDLEEVDAWASDLEQRGLDEIHAATMQGAGS